MLNDYINETSVWLDSLEDINTDVSLIRILCCYNYLSLLFCYPYEAVIESAWGYGTKFAAYGDNRGYFSIITSEYGEGYQVLYMRDFCFGNGSGYTNDCFPY